MKYIKEVSIFSLLILVVVSWPVKVLAHVVVSPDMVETGSFETFKVNVPNEKKEAVTEVRLLIPSGITTVTPSVKNGWETSINKTGDTVSELVWSGGSIPPGMQDEFSFTAQVASDASTLPWKAYQTYQNGEVAAWDKDPSTAASDHLNSNAGPYSTTQVVNDMPLSKASENSQQSSGAAGAYVLAGLALVLAIIALTKKQ